MRRGEKARRAMREQYQAQQEIVGKTNDGKPFTKAHAEEFGRPENVALHEACHAVAAWLLNVPIHLMRFIEGEARGDLGGETQTGIPLPQMLSAPIGERVVYARQQAFIDLSGVFGSGQADSPNPLFQFVTRLHVRGARDLISSITGIHQEEEIGEDISRLISHAKETFEDRRVQGVAHSLADQFLKQRRLTGEQVVAILSQAWPEGIS
jgi:ATP-dependent Zn protease